MAASDEDLEFPGEKIHLVETADQIATGSKVRKQDITQAEIEPVDENVQVGIMNNCNYFAKFLNRVKGKDTRSLNDDTNLKLAELRLEMKQFLLDADKSESEEVSSPARTRVYSKPDIKNRRSKGDSKQAESVAQSAVSSKRDVKKEDESKMMVDMFKKFVKANDQVSDDGQESDDTTSSSSSSSVSGASSNISDNLSRMVKNIRDKKVKTKSHKAKYVDYRQVPKMGKFREESGQDLKKYFARFEDYCEQNYRGGTRFWLSVLEEHLDGKILENFQLLREPDDEYFEAKSKLLKWFNDSAEARKQGNKHKFISARPKHGESLYLFSIRLASVYKTAYPKHDIKKSSKLIKQFTSVISKDARNALNTQIISRKLKGKKPSWDFVQKCVKIKDLDDEMGQYEVVNNGGENKREIVINLTRKEEEEVAKQNNNYERGRESQGASGEFRRRRTYSNSDRSLSRVRNNRNELDFKTCFTCKKPGHFAKDCWRNLGLCLVCGEEGHFIQDCPNKREDYEDRRGRNGRARGQGRRNSGKNFNPNYEPLGNNRVSHFGNRSSSMRGHNVQGYAHYNNNNRAHSLGSRRREPVNDFIQDKQRNGEQQVSMMQNAPAHHESGAVNNLYHSRISPYSPEFYPSEQRSRNYETRSNVHTVSANDANNGSSQTAKSQYQTSNW